ncbi:MAG: molybdopterin-dependent oxidoreductase [Acidimicrobiia bacterium]|nr:molybdopterin-dependent oxidoreductase [Acidimicrobiia bacterium]
MGRRIPLRPDLWVGLSPTGIGHTKPRHEREMLEVLWDNRAHPRYAWDVLTKGVCDGCALGVAGLHDWTIDGIHLCTTRLRLLEVNTADPIDPIVLSDCAALSRHRGDQLRRLGRLAYPMRRRRGEEGFSRVSWDEALDVVADGLRAAGGERSAMYVTSRGLTNETYYVAGKAARALGIASVDSAARVCHAPSTVALKESIGVAACTCSLTDVLETDLLVVWGANPANNQPVFMKHLYEARRGHGTKVAVVNPYLEPGLDRYWVPSSAESAVFGTRMCDLHVPVRPGGDVAFANAVLQRLVERGALDRQFIERHTEGWATLEAALGEQRRDGLLAMAGVDATTLDAFVDLYAGAGSAILLWSMGITQHTDAVGAVRAIVNVALARGNIGRNGAGLMPFRGHSGVQGGAEMGCYATALPGGVAVDEANAAALAEQWGFDVPSAPGLTAAEMPEAIERGELDVLWMSGGNFLDVLPDPPRMAAALEQVPLRVHQDIVVSTQMLVPGEDVVLLPVTTRYEQEGGGTETTTERRIAYSPEIPRRVGEARTEWRLFAHVATRVRPELAGAFSWPTNVDLRREIAEVVPTYAGIEALRMTGDAVQWGGRHLCADGAFPTPSGRGQFAAVVATSPALPEGCFTVATRRGKQFNSMVWSDKDPLTGARRDAVFMDPTDAAARGVAAGGGGGLRGAPGGVAGRAGGPGAPDPGPPRWRTAPPPGRRGRRLGRRRRSGP